MFANNGTWGSFPSINTFRRPIEGYVSHIAINIQKLRHELVLTNRSLEEQTATQLALFRLNYVNENYSQAVEWLSRSRSTAVRCKTRQHLKEVYYQLASLQAQAGEGLAGLFNVCEAESLSTGLVSSNDTYHLAEFLRFAGLSSYASRLYHYAIEQGLRQHHLADSSPLSQSFASLAKLSLLPLVPIAAKTNKQLPLLTDTPPKSFSCQREAEKALLHLQEGQRYLLTSGNAAAEIAVNFSELTLFADFVLYGAQQTMPKTRAAMTVAQRLGRGIARQHLAYLAGCMHLVLGHHTEALDCLRSASDSAAALRRHVAERDYRYALSQAEYSAAKYEHALDNYSRYVRSASKAQRDLVELKLAFEQFLETKPLLKSIINPTMVGCEPQKNYSLVDRVVKYMQDNLTTALTSEQLAQHVGISSRALELAFKRQYKTSPMVYFRRLRLQAVRDALINNAAPRLNAVAKQYGFLHGSTLIRAYQAEYGELPSKTLRKGAGKRATS